MWSSAVASLQLEKGRLGMVTISFWPVLQKPYSPSLCQAGCGAPWPGSTALFPRGEGAERGRRGLKVERLFHRAVSELRPLQAQPQPSGLSSPPPAPTADRFRKTGRVYTEVLLKVTDKAGILLSIRNYLKNNLHIKNEPF